MSAPTQVATVSEALATTGVTPEPAADREVLKTRIFIRNLPFFYGTKRVQELLADLTAAPTQVVVPSMAPTQRKDGKVVRKSKGYAFAEFATEDDAKAAIDSLDGREIVLEAKEEKKLPERKFALQAKPAYAIDEKRAADKKAAEPAESDKTASAESDKKAKKKPVKKKPAAEVEEPVYSETQVVLRDVPRGTERAAVESFFPFPVDGVKFLKRYNKFRKTSGVTVLVDLQKPDDLAPALALDGSKLGDADVKVSRSRVKPPKDESPAAAEAPVAPAAAAPEDEQPPVNE